MLNNSILSGSKCSMRVVLPFLILLFSGHLSSFARETIVNGVKYRMDDAPFTASVAGIDDRVFKSEWYIHLVIPQTISYGGDEYVVISVDDKAFDSNEKLNTIELPNSITSIGKFAFHQCRNLCFFECPSELLEIGSNAFSGCTLLDTFKMSDKVVSIGGGALSGTGISEIEIPSSVKSIGEGAFSGCYNLKNVEIPEGVTTLGKGAFSGCKNLMSAILPNSVTVIGSNTFNNCRWLRSVKLGDFVTDIGEYAFNSCKLNSIKFPKTLKMIGSYAFSENAGWLETVEIPDSVSYVGFRAFENSPIKDLHFKGCPSEIRGKAFYAPVSIEKNIHISDVNAWCDHLYDDSWVGAYDRLYVNDCQVNTLVLKPECGYVGIRTFLNAPVKKIRVDGISVRGDAFMGSSVEKVCLNVDSVEYYSFWDCKKLNSVYCLTDVPPVVEVDLSVFPEEVYENAILYVPVDTRMRYKSSECWWRFKNIVESNFEGIDEMFDEVQNEAGVDDTYRDSSEKIDFTEPYEIYDINGSRLNDDIYSLPQGMYIIYQNGKSEKFFKSIN